MSNIGKRKAKRLKASTVIKRRNTKTEAARRWKSSLSEREMAVRISLNVDLTRMFDTTQMMFLDYKTQDRVRMQIRENPRIFQTKYSSVYDAARTEVLRMVQEYDSKVQQFLNSLNFLRKANVSIPFYVDFSKYGTIVQLAFKRNKLHMDVVSEDRQERVTLERMCCSPRERGFYGIHGAEMKFDHASSYRK